VTLFAEAGFVPLPIGPFAPARTSRWMVAHSSPCFEGHFEGSPILPGVAHLALALRACREEGSGPGVLVGLKDVRFKRPLGPGDEVEVELAEGSEPSSVRFEIRILGGPASIGLLLFADTGASHG
jgi:Polyketide synthase dehydratase